MTSGPFIKKQHLGGWDPWQLTGSVLAAWWAADDLVDGSVASWSDRVTGLAVTQGTSGSRPLKASNSFNGAYPGVSFDGIDDNLATTTMTTLPTGAAPGGIWVAGTCGLGGIAGSACAYGGSASGVVRRVQVNSVAGARPIITDNSGVLVTVAVVSWLAPAIVKGDWSGTTMNGYANGQPGNNPAVIGSLNTGTVRLRLGATTVAAPTSFWTGPIRHVLITKTVISVSLQQKMEGYFAWDSGFQASLPDSHPYKRFHP